MINLSDICDTAAIRARLDVRANTVQEWRRHTFETIRAVLRAEGLHDALGVPVQALTRTQWDEYAAAAGLPAAPTPAQWQAAAERPGTAAVAFGPGGWPPNALPLPEYVTGGRPLFDLQVIDAWGRWTQRLTPAGQPQRAPYRGGRPTGVAEAGPRRRRA